MSSSPESWLATYNRWANKAPPRMPCAGGAPESDESIFGRLAGLLTFEVSSGGNVNAACKGLVRAGAARRARG